MKSSNRIKNRIIQLDTYIIEALKKMDEERIKLLFVFNHDMFLGLITIGDIQRAIINNVDLNQPVSGILDQNKIYAKKGDTIEIIKKNMLFLRCECMPIIDHDNNLIDVIFWEDLFGIKEISPANQFDLPVVIMAGGIGSRLKPLTNVLPKPLIPIGDKTMLEEIFDRFAKHGCSTFHISVNYKAELIEYYLLNQKLPYKLNFFKENSPMGTAGSLSLLKGSINETFFVSNCDILIDQDYSEILAYHRETRNEITLVAALKNYPIPYGTVETGEHGHLLKLREKPDITFKINSGMYILEPHLLDEINPNCFLHITDLIEKVINRGGTVGVFPVSEKSWEDVGNWEEYMKFINKCSI